MTILFLCVANSARSQMAEGLARQLLSPEHKILSAGSNPSKVNPYAIKVLQELGIDSSAHSSKSVADINPDEVDIVITLCAEEVCPAFLGKAKKLHWPHMDPVAVRGSDTDILNSFRTVRDQISDKIKVEFKDYLC